MFNYGSFSCLLPLNFLVSMLTILNSKTNLSSDRTEICSNFVLEIDLLKIFLTVGKG